MPLYEWRCPKCEAITEQMASFEDKDKIILKCPKCHTTMTPVAHSKPAKFQWGKAGGWN